MASFYQRLYLAASHIHWAGGKLPMARHNGKFLSRVKQGKKLVADIDVQLDTMINSELATLFPNDLHLAQNFR